MAAARFQHIVDAHKPHGYKLTERPMKANFGLTTFQRTISCEPILDRASLFVFLHECGHVHLGHLRKNKGLPEWRQEYEADQYAIGAFKALKLPLPREQIRIAKQVLREHYIPWPNHGEIDEEVIKYAYGSSWRKHR